MTEESSIDIVCEITFSNSFNFTKDIKNKNSKFNPLDFVFINENTNFVGKILLK